MRARGNDLRSALARIAAILRHPGGTWSWRQRKGDGKPWAYEAVFETPGTAWALVLSSFAQLEGDGVLKKLLGDYSTQWMAIVQPFETKRKKDQETPFLSAATSWSTATSQATDRIDDYAARYKDAEVKSLWLYLGDLTWISRKQWLKLSDADKRAASEARAGLSSMGPPGQKRRGSGFVRKKPAKRQRALSSSTSKPKTGIATSWELASPKKGTTRRPPTSKPSSTPSGEKVGRARASTRGTGAGTTSSGASKSRGSAGSSSKTSTPAKRPKRKSPKKPGRRSKR